MSHVLAVRLDNEGDVLLAGPAIRALRARAGRLTLLCGPRGRRAGELLPGVDEVITWQAPWIDAEPGRMDPAAAAPLVDAVAACAIDRAVIFTSFHQSALPTALVLRQAGVPWVGAISDDYPGALLDLRHRVHDDLHEVQRNLSLARAAGGALPGADDGELRVRLDLDTSPELDLPASYVVVHPGASVPARAWAPASNAELVSRLAAAGRNVVVTGGPGEVELTRRVAGRGRPGVVDAGGRTSLAGLARVLAGADCVVVGNTGPAHLAAAVGTPVACLYAPTVPAVRWRPWRVAHELLGLRVPCAGCRARTCPVPGHPCLGEVAVEQVLAAVQRLTDRRAAAAPRPVPVLAVTT